SLVIQTESLVILDESHEIHDKSHEPHVEGIPIPVEGTWYDIVDEAIDMYSKYAEMGGFEVKKAGQRYNMKFVPFIGIDNHGKCVTLGTRMLLHEDTKSYTWLLNAFMTAFLEEPTMIVTDQDGSTKRAIEAVFTKAKHRLCMWHIMQKIPSKICKEIYDKTNFKERLDKIVGNMFIEPLKFEGKWAKLIKDFGLQNHKWMTKMFNLQEIWIPAYFIDSPLFGLMRTTSRPESENSCLKSFTSPGATLVSFMMSYESAMERQRYRQEALDFKTIDAAPKCDTKLAIERHAIRVYTRTILLLVQTKIIEGFWSCTIQDLKINKGCEIVIIRDKKPNDNRALNTKKEKEQEKKTGTVAKTVRDYKLKVLMEEVKADVPNTPSRNTRDVIGGIFSITKPNQIVVQNPTKDVNKGEHLKKGERLKSEREKALKVRAKKLKFPQIRTKRIKAGTVTPFANPERQFRARREVLPAPIHNIYTFYEFESSESDTENVDIETLTLEQYLALNLNNTRKRLACPDNSTFEVTGQLLRELRKISFSGGPTDSVVEHIRNVLEIASIFNAQESTLIQVFPLTLEGIAKRWFERTST
ncbi:FAR1-related sequence 5-like protein, partial [Tanacetum coccineum]